MKNFVSLVTLILVAFFSGIFGGFLGLKFYVSDSGEGGGVTIENHVYFEESDLVETIKEVTPAVVSIVVSKAVPVSNVFDPFHDRRYEVVFEPQEIAGGTGFIVSRDGLVLTNKHVLEGATAEYKIVFDDNREYSAEFVSEDPFDDVAVLKILPEEGEVLDLPVVKLGDSDNLQVGQRVLAVGNALAIYGNTVTSGIVSAKGREVFAFDDLGIVGENLSDLIQTDAAINFGNSGGPLVNLQGEVVGMNVAVAEFADNIGFAIPVNELKPVLASIEKYGEIIRPVLGVRFIMLSEMQAGELDVDIDHGAILISGGLADEAAVISGGAADLAGLKEKDVILEVDGVDVNSDRPLHKIIRNYNPGDEVMMRVWRGGDEIEVKVVLKSSKD